jgi:tRNA:m4X modification enzyme
MHLLLLVVDAETDRQQRPEATATKRRRRRVPCPVDSTHTVLEDQVEKHVKVCPKTKELQLQREQSFFREDCNSGGFGSMMGKKDGESQQQQGSSMERAKRVAAAVLRAHQRLFAGEKVVDVMKITLEDICAALPLKDLSQPELDAGLPAAVELHRIKSGGPKHLRQQASLVGHLRRTMTRDSSAANDRQCIVEMGAGRGMTGLVAAGAVAAAGSRPTELVMVERGASRSRADKILRKAAGRTAGGSYLRLESVAWRRIHCDVRHVDLPTALQRQEETNRTVAVLAKHLCGAGTDLALKSVLPVRDRVSSVVMATCCHGVCSWQDYVGRDYLREAMQEVSFGQDEFDLLRMWSGGTILDQRCCNRHKKDNQSLSTEENESPPEEEHRKLPAVNSDTKVPSCPKVVKALQLACDPQGLGRACQRLIDFGRLQYLQKQLFPEGHVELLHYVPESVTPQNAVLIAHRRGLENEKRSC